MNQLLVYSLVIGISSTIFMDIMTLIRTKLFGIKSLNYAFVGRWVLGWSKAKFTHQNIIQAPAQTHETPVGWVFHYFTGILWVFLFLLGQHWGVYPLQFSSVMIFALATTLVPFLIMQPAFGFGFFAQRTPAPLTAIRNSLMTHISFGLGIYISISCLEYFIGVLTL